jgi:4-hydroxy-3-polyprenylbenzoate decarboxylase
MHRDLREFLHALEAAGELHRVRAEVDVELEVAEIADRACRMPANPSEGARAFDPAMAAAGGKALLFERVRGCDFPLVINAYGSYRRMEMALGVDGDPRGLEAVAARIASLTKPAPPRSAAEALRKAREVLPLLRIGPRRQRSGPCQEVVKLAADGAVDLTRLPIIKCWPLDGDPAAVGFPMDARAAGTDAGRGRYVTLAGMHTIDAGDRDDPRPASHNIGMYRSQLLGPTRLAMHWHMHHDGASHWRSWKRLGKPMPIAICLGGESVMPYGATSPLPPGISELLMCGFLNRRGIPMVRARTVPLWVPANSEIVIEGWVSTECGGIGWDPASGEPLGPGAVFEGPFGDHTGFYSLPDRYPVVEVTALTHRRDAVYPTTVVGLPPQEDYYLGKATERVFFPLLRTVVHDIEDYHLPMFGCFHNAAFVRIRKAYPLQARRVMSSVWGTGQMAWTKMVFVFDEGVPIHDEAAAMREAFRRCDFLRDLVSVEGPLDILDHSAPWIGAGAKVGFDCTAKRSGEAWRSVPLGDPALPDDRAVADARAALERTARAADPDAAVHFPPEGLGRLAVVEVRAVPADGGAALAERLLAALPGECGAADFVIVRDAPRAAQDLGAHLAPWAEAFFLLASNADFWRDMVRRGRRVAVDATRKRAGEVRAGLPIRAYPPLVAADAATAALVDRRWAEYGFDGPPVPTRRVPS